MSNREYINQLNNDELFELFFCKGVGCSYCPINNECDQQCDCFAWLNNDKKI